MKKKTEGIFRINDKNLPPPKSLISLFSIVIVTGDNNCQDNFGIK